MTRKIILNLAISLDGFIKDIDGKFDWSIMYEEMKFENFLDKIDAVIYGRKSY